MRLFKGPYRQFKGKIEDWVRKTIPSSLGQTEIGMSRNFVKFRHWKSRQRETSTDQE